MLSQKGSENEDMRCVGILKPSRFSIFLFGFNIRLQQFQMKKMHFELKPLDRLPEGRSSTGNLLAKRLYRNNSLNKLTPINNSSILGSLNTSLIPSVSLRKLVRLEHSPPSLEISHGKIHLRRPEEIPALSQTGPLLKKKAALRKFEKIDSVTETFLPEELKADINTPQVRQGKTEKGGFKPSRKWLAKLKQGREAVQEKLTPADFIQLMEEEGGLGNQFCYLQKGDHPYDLRIVEFGGVTGDEYITISARGVTYFNWEGSRFVSLQEWRREAMLFERLMKLQFFGKYRLHKNFSNWKKYSRKIGMKKTTDKLKAELLVHDRHLRNALLATRHLCCRMEKENYTCFDDAVPALPFARFKAAQEAFLEEQFEKHLSELQEEIKCEVANSLSVSMRDFKEENKISSGKEAKGLPLLIGDQKNLEMPYTKEATLRVQQEKFKRFLKLVELLVVHSKVAMMNEATQATARKLNDENDTYREHMQARAKGGKDAHFKGKQYIECQLVVEEAEQRAQLRPSREELTNLLEDIVNKSIIKLVRNHRRIINDPDINAILYEGAQEQPKEADTPNTLKAVLGAEEKQEEMVAALTRSVTTSYSFLEDFSASLAPLVAQYFRNQAQLARIPSLTSADYFTIREWIEKWRRELQEMSKLSEEHQSAVFVLNFRALKEMAIQSCNLCLSKTKEVVPRILQAALRKEESELKEALRLMEATPIGIDLFILFQTNKVSITAKIDQFQDTLAEIGQLIEILKELGSTGDVAVLRGSKERKELGETLKALRSKLEEAEMHTKVHETYAQEEVRKMVPRVCQALQALYAKTKQPRGDANEMCRRVAQWQVELNSISQDLQRLKDYQRFLGMEDISEDTLRRFSAYFHLYAAVWDYRRRLDEYHQALLASEWRAFDPETVKSALEGFLEESEVLRKDLGRSRDEEYQVQYAQESVVGAVVGEIKKKIRPLVQAIECLRDPSLEEREQRFVRGELERRDRGSLAALVGERQGTVGQLLQEGVIEELDFLKKIVFKSKKQVELNSKMTGVSRFWGESATHSSKSLIDNFAQQYWTIAEEIDEKITVINCVREDPEIEEGEFKNRVESEKGMFDSLRTLLSEWEKHHNFLAYFEPIFAHAYWKGSVEGKAYSYAEANWKKLTKQISKDFSLRKLASQEKKHLAVLRENNAIFQQLKFAVEMFLNSKRQAFPKLYFLSDHFLLHLLLQDKDYATIDKHLPRIFPNLASLELNDDRNSPAAVRNLLGETLPLRPSPPKQVLELEEGLRVIEERMREAVRSGLLKCSNYYMQDDFVRSQWIRENILQVLLFIGNAEFTKLLEYDYLQPQGEDLAQLLTFQLSQIKELHALIREGMHPNAEPGTYLENKHKLTVLLLQAGHFRDIILRIMHLNLRDDNAYEWLREIRSYYNGNDLAITKYLTRSIDYGYEFVSPNYYYTIGILSERQMIEVVNTAALGYLPALSGTNQVLQALSNANARSYFCLALRPGLSASYLHNVCQGALSSNTFLELQGVGHLTEASAATISSFMLEAKNILERREAFHLGSTSKNGLTLPSFSVCLRVSGEGDVRAIQEHLRVSFRTIKVPEISISTYIHCITELAFFSADSYLGIRIQKVCEIINSCCGYRLIGLEEVRSFVLSSYSEDSEQFRQKIVSCLIREINAKFVQPEEVSFFEGVVTEVMLGNKPQELPKVKAKHEWDSKLIVAHLCEALKKKQACLLLGPSYSGKMHLLLEAAKASGVDLGEVYHTGLLGKEQLLGSFENGLWKEGIFVRHLKRLTFSQQEWVVVNGELGGVAEELLQGAVQGRLLQLNGQTLYLSPNWKFLFCSDVVLKESAIPVGCELIAADRFSSFEDELQHMLNTRIAKYFKSNAESFSSLRNLCVNNIEKVLRFRLKGRFLRPEHILLCFIGVLESVLAHCSEKQLEQRDNQAGVQKLFLWCLFWTLSTALPPDQAKKFESQLFEQVKVEVDRSQSLSLSRFEFDSPQGSFRRVQQPMVQLNDTPFLVSEEMEATSRFVELLIASNRHVLLVGEDTCGKSEFLAYLRESLGSERHSFLRIGFSRGMAFSSFQQLLYRKAKIVVNSVREKHLCAVNGKQLVLVLDDINMLEEESPIGIFLKSILSLGYYHDPLTLDKVYLSNVVVLAAENSTHEFKLSYDFTKCFKPVYLQAAPIRDIIELYHPLLNPQYAVQLCHNIASLHEFALMAQEAPPIYFKRSIDIPCRILRVLRGYQGMENIVKMWEYASVKLYLDSSPPYESFSSKLRAEIKNYSNLMVKNNQEEPIPVEGQDVFLKDLLKRYPAIAMDDKYADYYVYIAVILQLSKPFSLFTLNEPLSPSLKEEVLLNLCSSNYAEYFHPFRSQDITQRPQSKGKVVAFISDTDDYFDQLVDAMLSDASNDSLVFLVDFSSDESWKKTMDKHPSIIHFGCRYYKAPLSVPKLDLAPQYVIHFRFWLAQIQRAQPISPYSQQEISLLIRRASDKLQPKVEALVQSKKKICSIVKGIDERESASRRQLKDLREQLEELVKGEEKKRRELLQLKNSYQGELTEEVKSERNEKIQMIEIQLNEIMSQRRQNEDRMRTATDDIARTDKILLATAPTLKHIQAQLQVATTIKENLPKIVVFLALLEYLYTKEEAAFDSAIDAASMHLPLPFEDIMESLFNCRVKLNEKLAVVWLFAEKSIIIEDASEELSRILQQKYKNVHIIREMKDLQDMGQMEEDKAYIFVGEMRSEGLYLNDISSAEKEKIKKEDPKEREERFLKEPKEERPDYSKHIYFVFKEREREREEKAKDSNQINSGLLAKNKQAKEESQLPFRRNDRKATRLNTVKKTLSMTPNSTPQPSLKKQESRTHSKEKAESFNQLKQETTIKIKFKQSKEAEGFPKATEQDYQDYLTATLQNQIYYRGGKRVVSVQSKFLKGLSNVTFICKKCSPKQSREFIHKYAPAARHETDGLLEEMMEGVNPHQTAIINNLQQEYDKIYSKSLIQEKIMVERLLENTQKSFNQIAKNADFLQNIYENVKSVSDKLAEAVRIRADAYSAYFKYCLIWKDYQPLLRVAAPFFRLGSGRIKKIILSSIVQNEPVERDGELIEPEFKIDQNRSICSFRRALIKQVIINQPYLQSLHSICLLAILLEVKNQRTDTVYTTSFLELINKTADSGAIEKLLNQKQCSKELAKVFQAYLQASGDFIYHCHHYLIKRLQINLEEEYFKVKAQWQQLNENLIVIARAGADPFAELLAQKSSLFIKENSDHSKCLEAMVEKNFHKLVLVNFIKEESYTKILSLVEELPKQTELNVILLFTSMHSYNRCAFLNKVSQQRIIVLEQNRFPHKQISTAIQRASKNPKPQHDRILKYVLYHEISGYLKERIKFWNEKVAISNACFYHTDLFLSLISEAKIDCTKKIATLLCEEIFDQREDLQKQIKKILKKQEEQSLGKTHHSNEVTFEENSIETNHFLNNNFNDIKSQLTSAAYCQDFAKTVLGYEERKQLKLDMFYAIIPCLKASRKVAGNEMSIEEQWNYIESINFESLKTLETSCYKKESDVFKSIIREWNLRQFLQYKWLEHQVKALKATSRNVILTSETRQLLLSLALRAPSFGLNTDIQTFKLSLEKNIYYLEELYTANTSLKKLNIDYWRKYPQIINLYLYSVSRKGDLLTDHLIVKVMGEKEEKERGWLLGEVELVNCKYDAIKNCLQINEKNELKKIPRVALVLGEREPSILQTLALPLFFQGKEIFKLQIPSKFREEGSALKQRVSGVLKPIQ